MGVSGYIDDMKKILPSQRQHILSRNSDLKRLIDLRHIRNILSHEVGTLDIVMCPKEDIEWPYNKIQSIHIPIYRLKKKSILLAVSYY